MTDNFEVFPCPELDSSGLYHVHFFLHGLRHRPESAIDRVNTLNPRDLVLLMRDCQNKYDPQALALRTQEDHLIGYLPRYITNDVHKLLDENPQAVSVQVERVNSAPAPIQLRLLCSVTAPWPEDFQPFSDRQYQPLPEFSEMNA
ncbi:HIRAN domain-containing protein [Lyngbya confervoides]|uniref:HIRAN domain-containing protein n=1 Tax=Lyngbya confervoides BDU141951 TaxID=1574623 RepID=A0ABD4T2H4_9CYAN|nr:HIRAN domain-containing protein [Lyngbya confervoides]MCM1982777.1 HIRAN domain-containing protein [Lyngbya confervoides BDU141951]